MLIAYLCQIDANISSSFIDSKANPGEKIHEHNRRRAPFENSGNSCKRITLLYSVELKMAAPGLDARKMVEIKSKFWTHQCKFKTVEQYVLQKRAAVV